MAEIGSVADLFSNPNFQSLLAGIGGRLDPTGVGGALGGATQQYVQSVAAQRALAEQEAARKRANAQANTQSQVANALTMAALHPEGEQRNALIGYATRLLGGVTPAGQTGLNSVKIGPDRATFDFQLPALTGAPGAQATPSAGAPAVPTPQQRVSDIVPFY